MKTEILRILLEEMGYVSGQTLCDRLGVSRTAVWKCIHKLQEEGYTIEAVSNKGYRLLGFPDRVDESACQSCLSTRWLGKEMVYWPSVDSTNRQLKLLGEGKSPHGLVGLTDEQVSGRGRRGRGWNDVKGMGIAMSILLRPDISPERAPQLTLAVALAVQKALTSFLEEPTKIKWPNDIVVQGKKLCGILTEMAGEPGYVQYVVVGIGINVHQRAFPRELEASAISMEMAGGKNVQRRLVIAAVLEELEKAYEAFIRESDLNYLQKSYEAALVSMEKEVVVVEGNQKRRGRCLGITRTGLLRILWENGQEAQVLSGEVSVRGVYGYAE